MKVYIIIEHPDAQGGSPKDMADVVLGVFFDQRRAEDCVRGMISYISRYEGRELILQRGSARDETDTIWFQIIQVESQ